MRWSFVFYLAFCTCIQLGNTSLIPTLLSCPLRFLASYSHLHFATTETVRGRSTLRNRTTTLFAHEVLFLVRRQLTALAYITPISKLIFPSCLKTVHNGR